HHPPLHSFPTRRSSDLAEKGHSPTQSLHVPPVRKRSLPYRIIPPMIILLNGPLGIGKSETAWALMYRLAPAAMIDVDHVAAAHRSEEHTSELQSQSNLV